LNGKGVLLATENNVCASRNVHTEISPTSPTGQQVEWPSGKLAASSGKRLIEDVTSHSGVEIDSVRPPIGFLLGNIRLFNFPERGEDISRSTVVSV